MVVALFLKKSIFAGHHDKNDSDTRTQASRDFRMAFRLSFNQKLLPIQYTRVRSFGLQCHICARLVLLLDEPFKNLFKLPQRLMSVTNLE